MSESQPMSLEAFRAKKAAQNAPKKQPLNTARAKPRPTTNKSSTAAGAGTKRTIDGEASSPKLTASSLAARQDRARQIREQKQAERMKQFELSKVREAERKAAAEERKKRQEQVEKERKEELVKRTKDRQTQASAVRKSGSGIPVAKKTGSSRPSSSVTKSGVSSPSTPVRSKSRDPQALPASPRLSGLRKTTAIPQSSAGRKTTKAKPAQPVVQQSGGRSKLDTLSKLKSSGDNVRSPPKLEIDESILAAAIAAEEGGEGTVDIAIANLEDLSAKRQRDRGEANRVLLEAERHREVEANEEEEQRLFEELERLTAEEEAEELDVYTIDKEIMMEEQMNHEEMRPEMITTDEEEMNVEDDAEQAKVERLDTEEIQKKEVDEVNEETAKREDEDKEQMLELKHEEVTKRIQAEKEEESRRNKEEQERAERRKRLDMIMQRARSRAAASPPATIKSFGQIAGSSLSSLFSEQQPPLQNEGAVLSFTNDCLESVSVDAGEKSKEQVELIKSAPVQVQPVGEQNDGESSADTFDEILEPNCSPQSDVVVNGVVMEDDFREKGVLIELNEDHGEQGKVYMEKEANAIQAEEAQLADEADEETDKPVQDNYGEDESVEETRDSPESLFSRQSLVAELQGANHNEHTESDSQLMLGREGMTLDDGKTGFLHASSVSSSQQTTLVDEESLQPGNDTVQPTDVSESFSPSLLLTQLPEVRSSPPPDLPVSLPPDLPTSAPPDLPSLSPPALLKSLPPDTHDSVPLNPSQLSPDLPVGSLVQSSSLPSDGLSPWWTVRSPNSFHQEELRQQWKSADSDLDSQVAEATSNLGEQSISALPLHGSSPVPEDDEQEAGLADSGAEFDVGDQHRDSGISDEEAPPPLPESPPPELEGISKPSYPVRVRLPVENVKLSPPLTLLELTPSAVPDSDPPSLAESPPPPALPDSLPPNVPVTNFSPVPLSLPPDEVEPAVEAEVSLDSVEVQHDSQVASCVQEENQLSIGQVDAVNAIPESQHIDGIRFSSVEDANGTHTVPRARTENYIDNTSSDMFAVDTKVDSEEPLWKNVERVLESTIPFVLEVQRQTGLVGEASNDQEEYLWKTVESMTSTESNVGPLPVRREQLVMGDLLHEDIDNDDEGVV